MAHAKDTLDPTANGTLGLTISDFEGAALVLYKFGDGEQTNNSGETYSVVKAIIAVLEFPSNGGKLRWYIKSNVMPVSAQVILDRLVDDGDYTYGILDRPKKAWQLHPLNEKQYALLDNSWTEVLKELREAADEAQEEYERRNKARKGDKAPF